MKHRIERQAKLLKRSTNLQLSGAQKLLASLYRCSSYHELLQVCESHPNDPRLVGATITPLCPDEAWTGNWESALRLRTEDLARSTGWPYERALGAISLMHGFRSVAEFAAAAPTTNTAMDVFESIVPELDAYLTNADSLVASEIADTNATFFMVDDYDVTAIHVDASTVRFEGEVQLSGDQDEERAFVGDTLRVQLVGTAIRVGSRWTLGEVQVRTVTNLFWEESIGEV